MPPVAFALAYGETSRLDGSVHLDLDQAWGTSSLPFPTIDARRWGPQLRFSAPSNLIEIFATEVAASLPPFVLYGSGDFHHLSAILIRRIAEPFVLLSFDNHPDWDIRPPRWCCGGWINRALETRHVSKISVWGCGNFECWWPHQIFGNRRAENTGRLEVHPWADGRRPRDRWRRGAILRTTWRTQFSEFVDALKAASLYITIDLDCLTRGAAVTNWENGRFTLEDLSWALTFIRERGVRVIGADLCGAFSLPLYARTTQRLIAALDHPKLPSVSPDAALQINRTAFEMLWSLLTD